MKKPTARPALPADLREVAVHGIGLAGRTTCLEVIQRKVPHDVKGELRGEDDLDERGRLREGPIASTSLALTVVPRGAKFAVRMSVAPQADASAAEGHRRAALRRCRGLLLVVDSRREKLDDQRALPREVDDELRARGLDPRTFPIAVLWNKRDLPGVVPIDELARALNPWGAPAFEGAAMLGRGVPEAFAALVERLAR